MPEELELKAVVPDPAALRARLERAGAQLGFSGTMEDRRYDRAGELAARGEVLRIRTYKAEGKPDAVRISWKGPATTSPDGYKQRTELEYRLEPGGPPAEQLFLALGYEPIHAIDRQVEYWRLAGADLRVEWYPRMDVLLEVEGDPAAIEQAIAATGLPRESFTAESLDAFTARFARRGGRPAVSRAEL